MKTGYPSRIMAVGALASITLACNETSLRRSEQSDGASDAGSFDVGSIAYPCGNLIGTADEIAATPRARPDLELVALKFDPNRLTADQATYDRVVADIDAIAAANSNVAASNIPFFPPGPYMDGRMLTLSVDSATYARIKAGMYAAWDCINNYYELSEISTYYSAASVRVILKGNYNLGLLADFYRGLPGVTGVSPLNADGRIGDDPNLCAERSADQVRYAIMAAYGDCPAGCTFKKLYCYESTAAGVVTLRADSTECKQWYTQFCAP